MIIRTYFLFFLCVFFSFPTPASSDEIKEAEKAFIVGNYERALTIARPMAESGDARAQTLMGKLFYFGYGVKWSDYKAVEWWKLAVNQGNAEAQYWLSHMHTGGFGIYTDKAKAKSLLLKSASQNYAPAQHSLGTRFYKKKDYKLALEWLQKAAKQDYHPSQYYIGKMYYRGQGGTKDISEAHKWFIKAAKQNNASAMMDLGILYMEETWEKKDDIEAYKWLSLANSQGTENEDEYAYGAIELIYYQKGRWSKEQIEEAEKRAAAFLKNLDK